ncbi:hypothetical protein F3J44_14550 [Pantoea sp. Tr-811]|uniref:type II secretion system protein GspL n=1 Tax=Pantoea sp. Tr-811 TaxID=2608361 RepID=UPI0014242E58|nr:type II secretion system protein GspL [Pantoea sp. Tr-811]NIF27587.1 hypothetical protein [Pantoea sp. Tr-811]
MSNVLDIQLPPLAALTPQSALSYRLADRQGKPLAEGSASRAQLPAACKGATWRLHLHGDDSLALAIALPPLTGKRLDAAVQCAVQGLVLGDASKLHVAHGARQADGRVAVAWLGRRELEALQGWLQGERAKLGGLFPQPADGLPGVDLSAGLRGPSQRLAWAPVAAVWAGALLVWCLGLNVYAARVASEGEQLRQAMVTRVQQAFPQLPVVLNPLQQARQQVQAGQGGEGYARLLGAAVQSMPFLAGNVAALDYQDGALRITTASPVKAAEGWQAQLAEQGIHADIAENGWTLRSGPAPEATAQQELAHVD